MNERKLMALLSSVVVATTMVACTGSAGTVGASGGQSGGADETPKTITCADVSESTITIGGTSYRVVDDSNVKDSIESNICTSKVTSLADVFNGKDLTDTQKANIATFDTSEVTNFQGVFNGATNIGDLDLSYWDVSNVNDFSHAFENSDFNGNISSWVTDSAISMQYMFSDSKGFNQDLSSWNVSSVTSMDSMFNGAESFDQDLSAWDVDSVSSGSRYHFDKGSKIESNLLPKWKNN